MAPCKSDFQVQVAQALQQVFDLLEYDFTQIRKPAALQTTWTGNSNAKGQRTSLDPLA